MNGVAKPGSAYFIDHGSSAEWARGHPSDVRIPENGPPTTLNFWQSEDLKSVVIMQNVSIWTWWIENATWTQIVLPSPPGMHVFEVPVRYAFGAPNIFITP